MAKCIVTRKGLIIKGQEQRVGAEVELNAKQVKGFAGKVKAASKAQNAPKKSKK